MNGWIAFGIAAAILIGLLIYLGIVGWNVTFRG